MSKRLLTLGVLLAAVCLTACMQRISRTGVLWGAFASHHGQLYVVQYRKTLNEDAFPIPERAAPTIVSEIYEVMSLDLRGANRWKATGVKRKSGKADSGAAFGFDYVRVGEDEKPQLLRRENTAEQLRAMASIPCNGYLEFDRQDSRVLYLLCDDYRAAYRSEPPYESATRIDLSGAPGIDYTGGKWEFSSTLGGHEVYIWAARDHLYRAKLGSTEPVQELDRFAGADGAIELPAGSPRHVRLPLPEFDKLIAVDPSLRIHEVARENGRLEVALIRPGQDAKRFELRDPVVDMRLTALRYLGRTGQVIWVFSDNLTDHVVVSLDPSAGQFSKSAFSIH